MKSKKLFIETTRNEKLTIFFINLVLILSAFIPFTCRYAQSDTYFHETYYSGYENQFYWIIVSFTFLINLISFLGFKRNKISTINVLILLMLFSWFTFFLGEIGFMSGMALAPDMQLGFYFSIGSGLLSVIYALILIQRRKKKTKLEIPKDTVRKSVYISMALFFVCSALFIYQYYTVLLFIVSAVVTVFSLYVFYKQYHAGLLLFKTLLALWMIMSVPDGIHNGNWFPAVSLVLNIFALWFVGTDAVEVYFKRNFRL